MVMESRSYNTKYWSFFLSIVSLFIKIRLRWVSLFPTFSKSEDLIQCIKTAFEKFHELCAK